MKQLENRISSREVADMMEVTHSNLLKKIDAINEDFVKVKIDFYKYWNKSEYINPINNKSCREYQITMKGCEFLAHKTTGTKGNLFTDKYMDRFEQMKEYIAQEQYKVNKPKEELECFGVVADILKLSDSSKLLGVRTIYTNYGMSTNALPDYTPSNGVLKSVTELLKDNNINISAIKFNRILLDKGILVENERKSSKGVIKKFKTLNNTYYGENLVNDKNPKETQPMYYEDKFKELLEFVGVA